MNSILKQSAAALRVLLVFTVLLGVVYPLGVWLVSRLPGLSEHAEGSPVTVQGRVVGSALIGIDPVFAGAPADDPDTPIAENLADPADPYVHTRPSASYSGPAGYPADAKYPAVLGPADPATSGGSNAGAYNPELIAAITARKQTIAAREGVAPQRVPADAVTASGSGLDPSISVAYAELQAPRVARNNHLSERRVRELIAANTSSGGIGVPGVNVLGLNTAIRRASAE